MMEHPSVNVTTIRETMSLEEIQQKIIDLTSRLNFSYRTGNGMLIHQIQLVLNTYTRAYNEELDAQFGNKKDGGGHIDIS